MCNYWAYIDLGKNVHVFFVLSIKREDFSRLKLFAERITGGCWFPDSNFTIHKCTSIQDFLILDKNVLLAFLVQKSFWRSMWHILQYNLHFASYFDHIIQKQPKSEKSFIL